MLGLRFRSSRFAWTLVAALPLAAGCSAFADDAGSSADAIRMDQLPIAVTVHDAGTFDQEIDHPREPAVSLGTFKQRYWYTTEFANGPDSPVLFYFCGEATCSPKALDYF